MTACPRYPDDDPILRYVAGDLDEPELTAFEDHLFACDLCLARVERYQAAEQVLADRQLPVLPTIVSAGDGPAPRSPRSVPVWMLGAMAASLVVVAGGLWSWQRTSGSLDTQVVPIAARTAPAPAVAESTAAPSNVSSSTALQVAVLAMVTPPPYLPLTTRGEASAAARFAEAMKAYTEQDWPTAAKGLASVNSSEARFYQGVADLMRGDGESAATALEAVRKSGVEPYARESVFYLGKAALQRGDVAAARQAFTAARTAGASTAREADRLLTALSEIAPAR